MINKETKSIEINKFKYSIEFETIDQNVLTIIETITKTLELNLSGSLTSIPIITFSTFEKE